MSSVLKILKNALVEAPVLGYPDFSKPFLVYTDASYDGLGAMLAQEQEYNGETIIRALWYSGHSLNKHEMNYSATDLELHYAVLQLSLYIQSSQVTFHIDHVALTNLMKCKQPTGRLGRIQQALTLLQQTMVYVPGRKLAHVYALSRFSHLKLPKEFKEPMDPDFINPPLVEPKSLSDLKALP